MVESFARRLGGDVILFIQKSRQFELAQMIRQQNLRRGRIGREGGSGHAGIPETSAA